MIIEMDTGLSDCDFWRAKVVCIHGGCKTLPVSYENYFTIIYHALFGQDHEETVHFKHTHSRCDNHRHLSSPVKVAVYVMLVKHYEINQNQGTDIF